MTDTLLDAYEDAWRALRATVERADAASEEQREAMRDELAAAVNEAVSTRTRARETLAAQYGDHGQGDQVLFVRETQIGALASKLDGFVDDWRRSGGGKGLLSDEILTRVRPLLVEPGNPEAHQL